MPYVADPFKKNGALKKGRDKHLYEFGVYETFLARLEQQKPNAMNNVVKRLYEMAMQKDNLVVSTRAIELILAYGLGKPVETVHSITSPVVTFVRAEPPARIAIEAGNNSADISRSEP